MSMFYELMMKKKGIPSRYQEVEYIESTGTQYIDTGIVADNSTGLKVAISNSVFGGDLNFLGSRREGGDRFILNYINGNWGFGFGAFFNTNISVNQNIVNELSLNFKNSRTFIANGESYSITGSMQQELPTIYFFGQHRNTGDTPSPFGRYALHSAQISKGTSIVANFIPVYDTLTQKYGMWESVHGKFYGNAGTGDFAGA